MMQPRVRTASDSDRIVTVGLA